MDTVKIPLKIFTSYEALTEYYGENNTSLELGMYESSYELVVGHAPTAYSFSPQYFTDEVPTVPNYVPDSPIDYTISAVANYNTYGYVTGAGTYPEHSTATLNAYAYTGYKFDKWSNDVETSTYSFIVENNVGLTAIFEEDVPPTEEPTTEAPTEAPTTTEAPAGGVADPVLTYFLSPVDGENYSKLCVNATCETVGATTYLTISSNGTDMGPYDFELWKQMGTVEKDGVIYVKTVNLGPGEDMSTTATISSYAQLDEDTSSTVTATATYE